MIRLFKDNESMRIENLPYDKEPIEHLVNQLIGLSDQIMCMPDGKAKLELEIAMERINGLLKVYTSGSKILNIPNR